MSDPPSDHPARRVDLDRLESRSSDRAHTLHRELLRELALHQRATAVAVRSESEHLQTATIDELALTRKGLEQSLARSADGLTAALDRLQRLVVAALVGSALLVILTAAVVGLGLAVGGGP